MTNVQQNFMDTQIVKVSLLFGYVISYNSMNEIFFKLVNVIMKDQKTKHVTIAERYILFGISIVVKRRSFWSFYCYTEYSKQDGKMPLRHCCE